MQIEKPKFDTSGHYHAGLKPGDLLAHKDDLDKEFLLIEKHSDANYESTCEYKWLYFHMNISNEYTSYVTSGVGYIGRNWKIIARW